MSIGGALSGALTGNVNDSTAAPTIDQSGVNSDLATMAGDTASQQSTLNQENAMAQGQGPSAATDLLKSQTAQAGASADALAASGSGANGAGASRRQAMMTGASADQALGGQAATARSAEQIGAMGAASGQEQNMAGNQLAAAGVQGGLATSQAQIDQQNQQLQEDAQKSNQSNNQSTLSKVGGAISGALKFLDADFKEPAPPGSTDKNGEPPAHFTLREIRGGPNHKPFMALIDRTTGEPMAVATRRLSDEEHEALYKPHGAGPLDSPNRKTAEMHDMSMGGGGFVGGAGTLDVGGKKTLSPGYGIAGGGGGINVKGEGAQMNADSTQFMGHPSSGPSSGGGGPAYGDADMGGDPRFAEYVRRAHAPLYRAATKQFADADAMETIARTSPGDVPSDEDSVTGAAPKGYGKDLAHGSSDPDKRKSGFQDEVDNANAADDPDRARFMKSEGQDHFMPGSDDAEMVRKAYEADHGSGRGNLKDVVGGAFAGFADPKSASKVGPDKAAAKGPKKPSVQAPGIDGVQQPQDVHTPPINATPAYPDGEMGGDRNVDDEQLTHEGGEENARMDAIQGHNYMKGPGESEAQEHWDSYKTPEDKGWNRPDVAGMYAEKNEGGSLANAPNPPKGLIPGLDRSQYKTFKNDKGENEMDLSEDTVSGKPTKPSALTRTMSKKKTAKEAPDKHFEDEDDEGERLTRAGNAQRRRALKPAQYMDGELGTKDNPVDIDDDDATARASFERDLRGENDILESQRHPVNADTPANLDDAYGWDAPTHVEHDPALDWKGTPEHDLSLKKEAIEIARMNPYLQVRPLAKLFAKPPQKSGPTDWATAVAEGHAGEMESEAGAKNLQKHGLNLVPHEAEELMMPGGGGMKEASRRTKNRASVHDLLDQWKHERENKYADGEVGGVRPKKSPLMYSDSEMGGIPAKRKPKMYSDGEEGGVPSRPSSALLRTMSRKTKAA